MLSFHMFIELQRRLNTQPAHPRPRPFSFTLTQPLFFQTFAHSLPQRETRIYFSCNHLHTLSIATEGISPLFPFWNSSPLYPSFPLPHYVSYFHALMKCKFRKSFPLIFIQNARGCTPLDVRNLGAFDAFPTYPLSFHILTHSFFRQLSTTALATLSFSGSYRLFAVTTGVAYHAFPIPIPRATSHSSCPIAAKRLWCNNPQRRENSSRSGETTPLAPVSKNTRADIGDSSILVPFGSRAWVHGSNGGPQQGGPSNPSAQDGGLNRAGKAGSVRLG